MFNRVKEWLSGHSLKNTTETNFLGIHLWLFVFCFWRVLYICLPIYSTFFPYFLSKNKQKQNSTAWPFHSIGVKTSCLLFITFNSINPRHFTWCVLEICRGLLFSTKWWSSCPIAARIDACPRLLLALESAWTNQRSPPCVQPFCKKIKQVCRPTFASDLQFFSCAMDG